MRIATNANTDTANPFLADVSNRMRKGLRASSADDALAQLLGPSYDHPATQLKQTPPSRPTAVIVPVSAVPQVKDPAAYRPAPIDRSSERFSHHVMSVYASQVRGSMLDTRV